MKRIVLVSLVAVVFVACQDRTLPTEGGFESPNFTINDGSSGGNVDVFFLPPLVVRPKGGEFGNRDANAFLAPVARLCLLDGDVCAPAPVFDDLTMVFGEEDQFYKVERVSDDLVSGSTYRIQIFLGTLFLAHRDVQPVDEQTPKCEKPPQVDVCLFQNGDALPIKVRIETGAACLELGGDPDNCATATLAAGGTLELQGVATATPAQAGSINIQTCFDLRDSGNRPLAGDGRVDNRTFGPCVEIIPLDPDLSGVATLCEAFGLATSAGSSPEQAGRMTVHRHSASVPVDAFAVALSHADGPACATSAPEQALELNSLERFVRFARNTWRAVSDRVVAWIEPAPLFARTMFRCNRGGCSSSDGFRSSYQAALPAQMDAPDGTALGSHPPGTVLTVRVRTRDSGELEPDEFNVIPPPSPELANDVRLTFTVTGGTALDGSPLRTGPAGGFTDDGIAEFDFAVGPGANTVVVSAIGVGTAGLGGTFLNVFGPTINDATAAEVTLGEGTLTFSATGLVQLSFFDLPGKNLTVDKPFHVVVCGAGQGVPLLVTLGAFNNNGTPQTLVVASPNDGDDPIVENADGTVSGSTNVVSDPGIAALLGCFDFHVAETKSGGIRFVASADGAVSITSSRFNVKPAKNN